MKALLILFLLAASCAAGSAQITFGGGAHTGFAFTSFPDPTGQFFGAGFGGGLHGDINFMPILGLRLNADYHKFPSDKTKLKEQWVVVDGNGNLTRDFTVEGANITMMGLTANLLAKLPTGTPFRPYGLVGAGLRFLSMSDEHVVLNNETIADRRAPDGTTNFGLNIGAGAEFSLSQRTSLYLDATYAMVFTEGGTSSYLPITVGVSF